MNDPIDFTEGDILRVTAHLIDAADPRLAPAARNRKLDEANAINADLTLIILGNMMAGLFDRTADLVSQLEGKPKSVWIEDYLVDMRKGLAGSDISGIFREKG